MDNRTDYKALFRKHLEVTLLGSLIAVLPAVPFYIYTFDPTPRQLEILFPMGIAVMFIFTAVDIIFITIYMRPVKRYLLGQQTQHDAVAAYKRALNLPTLAVGRVFVPHALSANIAFQILIMTFGKSANLRLEGYQIVIYWVTNLTLVPISHAIFEFYKLPGIMEPFLRSVSENHDVSEVHEERRLGLAVKLFALFILLGMIPIGVLSVGGYFKTEKEIVSVKAWDLAAPSFRMSGPLPEGAYVSFVVRHDSVFADIRAGNVIRSVVFPYTDVRQLSGATLKWLVISAGISFGIVIFLLTLLASDIRRSTGRVVSTLKEIKDGNLSAQVKLYTSDEFSVIGSGINSMAEGLKEREIIRDKFGKYFSEEIAELILGRELLTQGEKVHATILFADLRNSTRLSSELEPDRFVEILNRFLSALSDGIFENGGIVDKFIGDAALGVFGTPIRREDHAVCAARAAVSMREKVRALSAGLETSERIEVGIGIHSGEVIAGNIGSSKKLEYTVIGETVNLASRLEGITKEVGCDIVISEPTRQALDGQFECTPVGPVRIRGLSGDYSLYHLVGLKESVRT